MPCLLHPHSSKQGNGNYRQDLYLILLLALLAGACQPKDTNKVASPVADYQPDLILADSLRQSDVPQDISTALQLYRQLIPTTRNRDSFTDWLTANRRAADILDGELEQHTAALALIDSALHTMKQWREPATTDEYKSLARLYNRAFSAARDEGAFARQKAYLDQAEVIHKTKIWGKAHSTTGYFLGEMAAYYIRMGDFDNAVQYFKQCIAYEQEFDQQGTLTDYNNYGDLYLAVNDYAAALEQFNSGLAVMPRTEDTYYDRVLLRLNKAETLVHLGQFGEASQWNETARNMINLDSIGSEKYYAQCLAGYWENQAIIAQKQGNWAGARLFFEKITAPDLAQKLQRRNLAGFYTNLAETWYQEGNYARALEQYHAAFLKFYPGAGNSPGALPEAGTMPGDKILANILEGKARCWAGLGQYEPALAAYALIPEIETQLRATHTFEKTVLLALQKSRQRFDNAVDIAWEAWQKTNDPKYAARAFLFTEMARGSLQTKGLNANEALALLRDDQQQQDKTLSDQIASRETKLAEAEEETAIAALMQEIRRLKNEQKILRTTFAQQNIAYGAAISDQQIIPFQNVATLLRPGQTMLDFYFSGKNWLYTFSFDVHGNAAWMRQAWSTADENATDSLFQILRRNPEDGDLARFVPPALGLGQKLLQRPSTVCLGSQTPALDTALVIVPDLTLTALPFEALLLAAPATAQDWAALPFVVQQHGISYAYSATLLLVQKSLTAKRTGKARIPFAGFAPAYSNGADALDNAEDDVRFGAELFGGKPYVGPDASEAAFRNIAEQAQVLLLSMHGISNYTRPALSKLRFGDELPGNNPDNVLYANELQAIPCRADLAVMSACFTGDGPVQLGEGVYSMARSFAISGVPATAMSLWKFPVRSSTHLVKDFLKAIKNKSNKDTALRTAKRHWLTANAGTKLAHPYFWAGMVTAGDSGALSVSSTTWWYWLAGFVVVAVLTLFFTKKYKK